MVFVKVLMIRHGEGTHNVDEPRSFSIRHPVLTEQGKREMAEVRARLGRGKVVFTGPSVRTVESGLLISERVVCVNLLGPRVFPYRRVEVMACDEVLSEEEMGSLFPGVECVGLEGFRDVKGHSNELAVEEYVRRLDGFFRVMAAVCEELWIVTHDGVIASVGEAFAGVKLVRDARGDLIVSGGVFEFEYES